MDRRTVCKNLIALPFMGGFTYAVLKDYAYKNPELNLNYSKDLMQSLQLQQSLKPLPGCQSLRNKYQKVK